MINDIFISPRCSKELAGWHQLTREEEGGGPGLAGTLATGQQDLWLR